MRKSVFISYSWDSKEHQEWVHNLVNRLRAKGIIADMDIFETQQKSIHLHRMMVEKVRDSDFVIIVLTENYAKKADNFEGGVGFETQLALPLIMENPNKLIPIMLHNGDFSKVFPYHLKGQHAIDFSIEEEFEEKFEELIYRLYEKPRYFVEPIGEVPTLEPKIPSRRVTEKTLPNSPTTLTEFDFSDLDLHNHKTITDRDKERFMKNSFKQILNVFDSLFTHYQSANQSFDFDQDNVDSRKTIFTLYKDGQNTTAIKIWYGGFFGRNSINLSYGSQVHMSDNSTNEIIICEVDSKNQLNLKMTMNSWGNRDASTPEDIVKEIWKSHISHYLK